MVTRALFQQDSFDTKVLQKPSSVINPWRYLGCCLWNLQSLEQINKSFCFKSIFFMLTDNASKNGMKI